MNIEDVVRKGRIIITQGPVYKFVESDDYASNFSLQWQTYSKTQLEDSNITDTDDTFFRKTGLLPSQLKGKLILDAGCGMGRFTDTCLRHGARVVGVDLSDAVFSAAENTEQHDNVLICQANLLDLPFKEDIFDIIFSIGVLHHTPDPKGAFDSLYKYLKPGGTMSIWVYEDHAGYHDPFYVWLRELIQSLDSETLLKVCRALAPLIRDEVHYNPHPTIPKELINALRLCINVSKNDELCGLDTFDWLGCKYQFKYGWEEIEYWFSDYLDVRRLDVPIAVTGRKPE